MKYSERICWVLFVGAVMLSPMQGDFDRIFPAKPISGDEAFMILRSDPQSGNSALDSVRPLKPVFLKSGFAAEVQY